MTIKEPGYRHKDTHLYNQLKHQPYDYERNGLLNKLLPKIIVETENESTRFVLSSIERVFVRLMKMVDELKHYKDWNYRINF